MSSFDRVLDAMDGLFDEFNHPTSMEMKLKAQINLLQLDLDLERNVCRNHERMLHQYDLRVHELDDRVDALETELEVAHQRILELSEQVDKERRQRLMQEWLCDTIEEFEALDSHIEDLEVEETRERKRLRGDDS